jgi:hypothetical protein
MKPNNAYPELAGAFGIGCRAATNLLGLVGGAALGAFGGLPGIAAGAFLGSVVGAMAATVLEGQHADLAARERKLEGTAGLLTQGAASPVVARRPRLLMQPSLPRAEARSFPAFPLSSGPSASWTPARMAKPV